MHIIRLYFKERYRDSSNPEQYSAIVAVRDFTEPVINGAVNKTTKLLAAKWNEENPRHYTSERWDSFYEFTRYEEFNSFVLGIEVW